ncbi:hypothetical protein NUM3379_20980 [Kineococcus sp. NUM-3379]
MPSDPTASQRLRAAVPGGDAERGAVVAARALARRQLRAAGGGAPDPEEPLDGTASLDGTPPGPRARHRAGPPPLHVELAQRVADRLPPGLRAARWHPTPVAAVGAVLTAALAAGAILLRTGHAWPADAPPAAGEPVHVTSGPAPAPTGTAPAGTAPTGGAEPGTPPAAAGGDTPPAAPGRRVAVPPLPGAGPAPAAPGVVVHVVGRVAHPGVVRLAAGSRVTDALAAAGGAVPGADLGGLNLARVLGDGEQVRVPAPGEAAAPVPAPARSAAGGAGEAPGAPVDLNTATEADLDALPGVGPVLAARIVAWRQQHGRFTDPGQLGDVEGIGPKLLADLGPLVRA